MKPHSSQYQADLTNCEKEPIHIPGRIQSFGLLLVVNPDTFQLEQISENCIDFYTASAEQLVGKNLSCLFPEEIVSQLISIRKEGDLNVFNPTVVQWQNEGSGYHNHFFNLIAHEHTGKLYLELEPSSHKTTNFNNRLGKIITEIQLADTEELLYQKTTSLLKQIGGYDRVMVYRFDREWNGEVIAERKNQELDPYLGLHYPASDIPRQARELYTKNWIRILHDVNSPAVNIYPTLNPRDNKPCDLTYSALRGFSPIHLEYLQNMGVKATMTVSIILNNKLWGLFACHHYNPHLVDYNIRTTCQFLGQIFSGQLSFILANQSLRYSDAISNIRARLLNQMNDDGDIIKGLTSHNTNLLNLNEGEGAAIYYENKLVTLGNTPDKDDIIHLIRWINKNIPDDLFVTHELTSQHNDFKKLTPVAAGTLAISLNQEEDDCIIWFKPEVLQQVNWGGNPEKPVEVDNRNNFRISPRKSFDKWEQLIRNKALPWKENELEEARKLRNDILKIIVRNGNKIKQLNIALEKANHELEAFSYSVSHDLRAPLRSIDGFAEILLEDYYEHLDQYGKRVLKTIVNSTEKMNVLINDMLSFSKLGRKQQFISKFLMKPLIETVFEELMEIEPPGRKVYLTVDDLPAVCGDERMIKQLISNLMSNALKYSRNNEETNIHWTGRYDKQGSCYEIRDNGIGMNMTYAQNIFNVFHRLHDEQTYEGNGIGLSIAKRIVERHHGNIWVESEIGSGTSFFFWLPAKQIEYGRINS